MAEAILKLTDRETIVNSEDGLNCLFEEGSEIIDTDLVYLRSACFSNNNRLRKISLYSCTNIYSAAFMNCSGLEEIYIPNVRYIDTAAFQYCSKLKSISLPKVTYINSGVFYNCSCLESVDIPNVTSIYSGAFIGCISLKNITLYNCNVSGGMFDQRSLEEVTLIANKDRVYVNGGTFNAFSQLTRAYLKGDYTIYLYGGSFAGSGLTNLYLLSSVKVTLQSPASYVFGGTPIHQGDGKIYVPEGLYDEYINDNYWKELSGKIQIYGGE